MPPVTGEPQLGGEETADATNHEKGRPPDEIDEDDRMDTSSRRLPSASMSKSTTISAQDSEHLKPSAPWKRKRKLESEEAHPHFLDEFQSEDEELADALSLSRFDITNPHSDSKHQDDFLGIPVIDYWFEGLAETQAHDLMEMAEEEYQIRQPEHSFQACLVHGTWASIENVRKISSSLLVNKPQCEHIADHFKVTGDVLTKLGLGKDFVSGQALEGGSSSQTNLTFDEMRFDHIAETFEKHFDKCDSLRTTKVQDLSREFEQYIRELPAMDGISKQFLSMKSKSNKGFRPDILRAMSMKEKIKAQSGYRVQHRLDEFLCVLFVVLKHGEALVLFHKGLEGANTGVISRTGMSGDEFIRIHELLYKLLDCYACLEHCEGTEFASGCLSRPDVCAAESILSYWNWNLLLENASLVIADNFLSIEMATRIAKLFKGSDCALKKLSIESSPRVEVDQGELRKCRLMIIAALSENVGLTSLTIRAANGIEVHELYKSLRANRVLVNLVISTDGPLADNDAMDLRAMLQGNRNLKSFTLEFDDVGPQGVVHLGTMLAEISPNEIYLRSRGFSTVYLKDLLGLSMAFTDGKCNVILSVREHRSFFEIQRCVFTGREFLTVESYYTQILRIKKTVHHFSIQFKNVDADAVCAILDSLKENKTLQVLELEAGLARDGRKLGDSREVAACLEALLTENSSLRELKVQFRAWDKCFVKHLLRPLMAEKDGEPHVNISLKHLHIVNISPDECGEVVESVARILRTNKTLSHFSMSNASLRTSDVCEIADSLKTNKALQVLRLKESKVFDDPHVKVAFIDLLVNYNFTLTTISWCDGELDIEAFMKKQLRLDTKMAHGELRSLVCRTSDSPIVRSAHDLEQVVAQYPPQRVVGTLQLEKGEGSTEEVCGPSERALDKHKSKVEAKDERPRLFLSYSKETRDFAMQLCMELKSSNYNVVDQDSINFVEAVDQCQLAIVVLSAMYVNSKPSMSELCTIVNSKKTNNPTLKVYPLFYKLTLQDLQNAYVPVSTFGGAGSSMDIALEKEALDFLCDRKNEVLSKANNWVRTCGQDRVDVGKFCEEFSKLQRISWPTNGLELEKNAISEEGFLHAILEEIYHYMPAVKECNNNQILGHQCKLEMESKLFLRHMKSLLESLPMRDFSLLRKMNMAQSVQEKYIQYSSFEEMCLYLSLDQKHEYSKGRIVAALLPTTFLYHLKVHILQDPDNDNCRRMLKEVGVLVACKMQKECNRNGVQMSTFFDFVDIGAPLDPRRTIAMCQNFSTKTSDGSKGLFIVQDDLTRAYYFQCNDGWDLQKPIVNEFIGVIGVQVTSEEIHVDNIHEDGSSYCGVLEDFTYKFDSDENKQCAAKAFGDLGGARFLSKNIGIKCSPLLIIALASATQKEGLTLTWRNGTGHIEFDSKLAQKVEVEAIACQIQYTSNINQLGLEIEWGMDPNTCPLDNQTIPRGTNEIVNQQVLESNVDQSMDTSGFRNDGIANIVSAWNMQNEIALLRATTQDTTTRSGGIDIGGFGANFSYEKHDPESNQVKHDVFQNIHKQRYASEGHFHRKPNLEDLENRLLSCQLHEVYDHNYLVVHNNVSKARHISIYEAIEQKEAMQPTELIWISDFYVAGGEKQIQDIFEKGLKGRELSVRRDGSNYTQVGNSSKPLAKIVPSYQEYLSKLKSQFSRNAITSSMIQISVPNIAGMLKSKNEWVHILGSQGEYEKSYKYWWNATFMEAIVYSRTMYTSGTLLTTCIEKPFNEIGHIGNCSIKEDPKNKFKHSCGSMVSRGKFSRPRGSLLGNKVMWGGLDIEP